MVMLYEHVKLMEQGGMGLNPLVVKTKFLYVLFLVKYVIKCRKVTLQSINIIHSCGYLLKKHNKFAYFIRFRCLKRILFPTQY